MLVTVRFAFAIDLFLIIMHECFGSKLLLCIIGIVLELFMQHFIQTSLLCASLLTSVVGEVASPCALSYDWEYIPAEDYSLDFSSREKLLASQVYVEAPSSLSAVRKFPIYLRVGEVQGLVSTGQLPAGFVDYFTYPTPSSSSPGTFYFLKLYATSASEVAEPEYQFVAVFETSNTFYLPVYYSRVGDEAVEDVLSVALLSYYPVPSPSGDGVGWLYNFGQFLTTQVGAFSDILNLEISGHSVIYLMCTSGFMIYASWVVIKWLSGL